MTSAGATGTSASNHSSIPRQQFNETKGGGGEDNKSPIAQSKDETKVCDQKVDGEKQGKLEMVDSKMQAWEDQGRGMEPGRCFAALAASGE
jgi:hypothetical protein